MIPDAALPPLCACGQFTRPAFGSEVYPHLRHLHHKKVFLCVPCWAYVGTHPDGRPLGTPANRELRRARQLLHVRQVDPLWLNQPEKNARTMVYAFLAERLGLTADECHVGCFDLERCRDAWRALRGVTFQAVKKWYTLPAQDL